MLSELPRSLKGLAGTDVDKEVLRVGLIAELDAINLYEQLAAAATNKTVKKVLADIAREEKTHVGEFQALLLQLDKEQEEELRAGKKEVDELKSA